MRDTVYIFLIAMLFPAVGIIGQELTNTESYQSPLYNKIERILLSPDRKTLIASDSSGYVFFWGRDGGIRKILRAHMQPVTNISISPNGAYMVTASRDNQIIIWDFLTGEKMNSVFAESFVLCFALSDDGISLYYATPNGVYKTSAKESGEHQKIYDFKISHADASDAGGLFAIAGQNGIDLLNLQDGSMLNKTSSCSGIKKVEFEGNLICSLCEDGSLRLFELKGKAIHEINSGKSEMSLTSRIIITDDKQVLLADRSRSTLWNSKTGKFSSVNEIPPSTTTVGYGEDGAFYIGNSKGQITVWKPVAVEEIKALSQSPEKKSKGVIKVETTKTGVPATLEGRAVRAQQPVEVNSPSLDIYVWDDEREDGDTISLNLNGEWILQNYMITSEKKKLTINLTPGKINYLILYAHNLGKIPPNTAVVSFHDGQTEQMLTVESDLKKCGAVTFSLKQ